MEVRTIALRRGLEYYLANNLFLMTLKINSLTLKKVLDGVWEIPSLIATEILKINLLRAGVNVVVEYTLREESMVADFFTSQVFFFFPNYLRKTYNTIDELQNEGREGLIMDKNQAPNLQIINFHNRGFKLQDTSYK